MLKFALFSPPDEGPPLFKDHICVNHRVVSEEGLLYLQIPNHDLTISTLCENSSKNLMCVRATLTFFFDSVGANIF